jgi:hypothetical protein
MVSIQILEADPIFAGVRQAPGYKDLVEKHP